VDVETMIRVYDQDRIARVVESLMYGIQKGFKYVKEGGDKPLRGKNTTKNGQGIDMTMR
jgi:hypothetical protein